MFFGNDVRTTTCRRESLIQIKEKNDLKCMFYAGNEDGHMRLTTKTNLAMRVLMFCAVNTGRTVRKTKAAEKCNASEAHLAVVIHQLGLSGYLETQRGRGGGIRLATTPDQISVGAVFREFEECLPFAECFAGDKNTCPMVTHCGLRPLVSEALNAFYTVLDRATLADLITGNTGLAGMLSLSAFDTDGLPAA